MDRRKFIAGWLGAGILGVTAKLSDGLKISAETPQVPEEYSVQNLTEQMGELTEQMDTSPADGVQIAAGSDETLNDRIKQSRAVDAIRLVDGSKIGIMLDTNPAITNTPIDAPQTEDEPAGHIQGTITLVKAGYIGENHPQENPQKMIQSPYMDLLGKSESTNTLQVFNIPRKMGWYRIGITIKAYNKFEGGLIIETEFFDISIGVGEDGLEIEQKQFAHYPAKT